MLHMILYLTTAVLYISDISATIPADGTQPNPCNSCCQGPSGLSGIPGPSGNNGLPGRDGFRGEKGDIGGPGLGEKGEKGERGPPGPQGPSGERGEIGGVGLRGLPGKVGPEGLKGMAGADGQIGPVGIKGQKGESGGTRRSAFTAVKTSSQTGNSGDVLDFDVVESNIGGNFNLNTDKFTCVIPGIYWFTFTIAKGSAPHDPFVYLVKDGTSIVIAYLYDDSIRNHATNGAVLQLAAGDQVWIRFGSNGEQVYSSSSSRFTTFSGFLLYED